MAAPPQLNFSSVLAEARRISSAHSRHFLALTVIFLLPLSFFLTIFPTLHRTLSSTPDGTLLHASQPTPALHFTAACAAAVLFLALCGIPAVTHSVFHGFFGRPVKLASAVRSLSLTLLPISLTWLFLILAFLVIAVGFGVAGLLILELTLYLGLESFAPSPILTPYLEVSAGIVVGSIYVFLMVIWGLVNVVVVVERKWGWESANRSRHLVRGMKRVSLSLVLYFGVFIGMLVWISWVSVMPISRGFGWTSVLSIVQIVATSALIALLLLHCLAASTVFYMYCKAMQGELAPEIAAEFAHEYMFLPFVGEKVPYIVSVAEA